LKKLYIRTLALVATAALAGLATAAAVGPATGWAVFSFGLLALLVYHVRHLARLARWLAEPVPGKVPEGSGTWDEVLNALHKYERAAVRRESQLEDALTRFRRAAQALPDGVIMLDAESRIEWCNDAAAGQLALDPRTDVGQGIANLLRAPVFVDYLTSGEQSPPVRVQLGNAIFSLQLVPYGDSQRLLLSRDVTQAERLETLRRDFVANVSHELRTPLTVLVGFLETVRELKLDPQRTRDYLGMMQDQGARMQRIIEDLLTLSLLESAPPPAADRVATRPLLQRLHADAQALSGGRHRITLEGSPAVDLLGAESEIASALGNLVSNAIRYTPRDGEVRIIWRDLAEGASFSVEDTGIGIAPEHLPRLTERFYRVDRSRSRETGGTGLGLAIVKHALARHQAQLDVESKPGQGSRFTIRFPAKRIVPSESDLARTSNSSS
jgi:two-component system phosphate regulon sensor histidine kinase PhoR